MKYDVCIIGAGLSGLAALHTLDEASLKIALVDDRRQLGGNFTKRKWLQDDPGIYDWLIDKKMSEAVDVFLNHEAVGVYADESLGITDQKQIKQIQADVFLQCTGSRELPSLFPGWQLPGVITLDAYLQLRHIEQVDLPKRIGLVGENPVLEKVAGQLRSEGFEVVQAQTDSSVRAEGDKQVQYLVVDGESHKVDIVITSKGYVPVNEIAHLYKTPADYMLKPQHQLPSLSPTFYQAGQSTGVSSPEQAVQSGQHVAKEILRWFQKEGA